jgi:predicted nucleotidyltransferase
VHPVLQCFVSEVRQRLVGRVLRISLFGSRARGTHKTYSDYDLMVVVRGDRRAAREAVAWIENDLLLDHGASVSPKVVTEADFEKLRGSELSFWRRFRRDEVLLWPT